MDEAISLLDRWLQLTTERSMFSADEVRDLLLDFRLAITKSDAPAELVSA